MYFFACVVSCAYTVYLWSLNIFYNYVYLTFAFRILFFSSSLFLVEGQCSDVHHVRHCPLKSARAHSSHRELFLPPYSVLLIVLTSTGHGVFTLSHQFLVLSGFGWLLWQLIYVDANTCLALRVDDVLLLSVGCLALLHTEIDPSVVRNRRLTPAYKGGLEVKLLIAININADFLVFIVLISADIPLLNLHSNCVLASLQVLIVNLKEIHEFIGCLLLDLLVVL